VKKLSYMLTVLVGLCVFPLAAQAQMAGGKDAQTTTKTTTKSTKTHEKSVTGCLAKGDEAGEYKITGENGKTYELRSKSVQFEPHIGHTVTVSGTWAGESAKEEMKEEAKESKKTEKAEEKSEKHPTKEHYLNVTDLKMVSETCKK
jgi:hypothetical protein